MTSKYQAARQVAEMRHTSEGTSYTASSKKRGVGTSNRLGVEATTSPSGATLRSIPKMRRSLKQAAMRTAVVLFAVSCRGNESRQQVGSRTTSCDATPLPMRVVADSLGGKRACALIRRSVAALESGRGLPERAPAINEANYRGVSVDAIAETNESNATLAAWWVITFYTTSRPYDLEVRIDQRTGDAAARPIHK